MTGPGQTCRGTLYLMPDFGTVGFDDISVADVHQGGSLATSAFSPLQLTMSGPPVLAKVTTAINKDAFNLTWEASG